MAQKQRTKERSDMMLRKRADLCYFDLQLFAMEGDDGSGAGGAGGAGGGGNDNPFAGFSGTMVEKKDPVSGQMIKIPVEMESYMGHMISTTRTDTESKYKPLVEKLESDTAELGDIRSEVKALREANMTAEEVAQENARLKIIEHETNARTATEKAVAWEGRFKEATIANDIFASFGDTKLCNSKQTAILFQTEGNAEVKEIVDDNGKPTNKFQTVVSLLLTNETTGNLERVEGTPENLFKRWIEEDKNLHLQYTSMGSGGGSGSNFSKTTRDSEELMKLPAKERLRRAREMEMSKQ